MATLLTGTAKNRKLIYRKKTSQILKNGAYIKRFDFVLLMSCLVLILFIILLAIHSLISGCGQMTSTQAESISLMALPNYQ